MYAKYVHVLQIALAYHKSLYIYHTINSGSALVVQMKEFKHVDPYGTIIPRRD